VWYFADPTRPDPTRPDPWVDSTRVQLWALQPDPAGALGAPQTPIIAHICACQVSPAVQSKIFLIIRPGAEALIASNQQLDAVVKQTSLFSVGNISTNISTYSQNSESFLRHSAHAVDADRVCERPDTNSKGMQIYCI